MSGRITDKTEQIAQLKEQIGEYEKKVQQLQKEYLDYEKVCRFGVRKNGNGTLIFTVILAAIGGFLYYQFKLFHWAELLAVGFFLLIGLVRKIKGVKLHRRIMKKHATFADADFRRIDLQIALRKAKEEQQGLKDELDQLENEEYYSMVQSVQTGRIIRVVTCENWPDEDCVPREPKEGEKYWDIDKVNGITIYADGSKIATGKKIETKQQKCFVCVARPGKASIWCESIDYSMNGYSKVYPDDNFQFPWVEGMHSLFCWYHVSINKQYSIVYGKNYSNLEELRRAVNLPKEEILKYL